LILSVILVFAFKAKPNAEFVEGDNLLILNGATLIDGTDNEPISNAVVIMGGKRILKVGKVGDYTYSNTAEVLQLDNKFLIPGLIDVHTHIQDPIHLEEMKMLLAYGVTTIRIPGGTDIGVKVREMVERGEIIGPRVFTGGRIIDGAGSDNFVVNNEEEMRKEVRRQHAEGVDLVKFYSLLTPNLIAAGVDEAHLLGIRAIGHLYKTSWTEASESGIDGLLHSGYAGPVGELITLENRQKLADMQNLSLSEFEERSRSLKYLKSVVEGPADKATQQVCDLIDINGPMVNKLIETLLKNNTLVDPTLVTIESISYGDEAERILSHLEPNKAPKSITNFLWGEDWESSKRYVGLDFKPLYKFGQELALKLFKEGVVLGAGSDVGMLWMTPGASLHRELELLVETGIPIKDVLQIATKNGAQFVYNSDNIGTIEEGKFADIVVLAANPLEDIRNTRKIVLVIKAGAQFNPKMILDALKD